MCASLFGWCCWLLRCVCARKGKANSPPLHYTLKAKLKVSTTAAPLNCFLSSSSHPSLPPSLALALPARHPSPLSPHVAGAFALGGGQRRGDGTAEPDAPGAPPPRVSVEKAAFVRLTD